jgi:hypothetical protein
LFQAHAEEVIHELVPAHLFAHILWLDIGQMYRVERCLIDWLQGVKNRGSRHPVTVQFARRLFKRLTTLLQSAQRSSP